MNIFFLTKPEIESFKWKMMIEDLIDKYLKSWCNKFAQTVVKELKSHKVEIRDQNYY